MQRKKQRQNLAIVAILYLGCIKLLLISNQGLNSQETLEGIVCWVSHSLRCEIDSRRKKCNNYIHCKNTQYNVQLFTVYMSK